MRFIKLANETILEGYQIEKYLDSAKTYLAQQPDLVASYLFGSQATGRAGFLSDVDVAVLLRGEVSPEKYGDIKLNLIQNLSHLFGREDIDVVILNDASPLLRHRVLSSKKLLSNAEDRLRVRFEAESILDYLDTQPLRKTASVYLWKWLEALPRGEKS
jgi:predicted nucleotidyltransferase